MTILRQKMVADMQLRGFSPHTQQAYMLAVRQLARFYNKSPEKLTQDDLRDYFLYLVSEKKVAPSTLTVALCGIKFFYEQTLNREWVFFELIRPQKSRKLPVILSQNEVKQILNLVYQTRYRVCLSTIYSCGLRLNEALQLTISDIDGERMVIHVRSGKGGKDRYVPLPNQTYHLLQQFWVTHKHPKWLFPGRGVGKKQLSREASGPMPRGQFQAVFRKAVKTSPVQKAATIHTLRHSYATHLLDAGVNLRQIQSYLGHSSLASTMIYMHLTQKGRHNTMKILDQLMVGFDSSIQLTQS